MEWDGGAWQPWSKSANVQSILDVPGSTDRHQVVNFSPAFANANYFMESSVVMQRPSATGYLLNAQMYKGAGFSTVNAAYCVLAGTGDAFPPEVGMIWAARFYRVN